MSEAVIGDFRSRAVMGIDATWTSAAPSGVAVAVETQAGRRLKAVEASYDRFLARASWVPTADA